MLFLEIKIWNSYGYNDLLIKILIINMDLHFNIIVTLIVYHGKCAFRLRKGKNVL